LAILIQNVSKKSGPVKISCHMELQESIDNFFLIGQMSDELKIIKIEQIINKACFLNNIECNEIFFSKCTELQEHD
jgi:hypothetical protein